MSTAPVQLTITAVAYWFPFPWRAWDEYLSRNVPADVARAIEFHRDCPTLSIRMDAFGWREVRCIDDETGDVTVWEGRRDAVAE